MKCLYFDCFAGFDPYMAAGALSDMTKNTEITDKVCGEGAFSLTDTVRGGMECTLFEVKREFENGFVLSEDIKDRIDSFNASDKTKTALKSMIDMIAEATAVEPDDAQFELSDTLPSLMAAATVLEIIHSLNVQCIYISDIHTSSENGLFGSFTSAETEYMCRKYNINTIPLGIDQTIFDTFGAALLAIVGAERSSSSPDIEKCGYGAGKSDFDEAPNILRAVLGTDGGMEFDEIFSHAEEYATMDCNN